MQTAKIAQAVKSYLVALAIQDKFPTDLNDISEFALEDVIKSALDIPTAFEEGVKKAMDLLSDGDLTTAEMVQAILDHEDPTDLIDNVEGVVVWQKVENSLSCEEFINIIGLN
jgi:hypothetical protein